jgi:hypothetical protein
MLDILSNSLKYDILYADLYVNLENDDISAPEQKNFLLFDVNIITFILLSLSNILKQ